MNVPSESHGRSTLPELARSLELVHRFKAGDEAALNELFERYRDRVLRIVGVRMGVALRRLMDEEDVVQEVFLVAAGRLEEFEPQSHASILGWLAAIAENKLREKARFFTRDKRDARLEVRFGSESARSGATGIPEPASPGPSPSQQNVWLETEELVDACVSSLEPDAYREVILQRDYYGASWEELRERLDRATIGAVQEVYRRAHMRLRAVVSQRLGD